MADHSPGAGWGRSAPRGESALEREKRLGGKSPSGGIPPVRDRLGLGADKFTDRAVATEEIDDRISRREEFARVEHGAICPPYVAITSPR